MKIEHDLSIANYLNDITKEPLLSYRELVYLCRKMERGNKEARDRIIRANLRWSFHITKRYNKGQFPFMDLIQIGNIGLMKAVDKFDWSRRCKFSFFARDWIRAYIRRFIRQNSGTVHIPVWLGDEMNRFQKAKQMAAHQLGRQPDLKEIAHQMNVGVENDKNNLRLVKKIIASPRKPVSVESLIIFGNNATNNNNNGDTLVSAIDNLGVVDTIREDTELSLLRDYMRDLLSQLKFKEQWVLRLRFGFADGHCHTLEEAGAITGVTRERVRQVEKRAIIKLRKMIRSADLKKSKTA